MRGRKGPQFDLHPEYLPDSDSGVTDGGQNEPPTPQSLFGGGGMEGLLAVLVSEAAHAVADQPLDLVFLDTVVYFLFSVQRK